MDELVKMVNEWTRESGKKGLETYIENVKFEAEERGEIRGRREAAKEKAKAIAKKMLNNNEPINKIEIYTGLTKKQIESLM